MPPAGDDEGAPRARDHSFGGLDWQVEMAALKQNVPRTQSASDAHGNTHFPYCRLQRWLIHIASFVHGDAAGPGTASVDGSAGDSGANEEEDADDPGAGLARLAAPPGERAASTAPHPRTAPRRSAGPGGSKVNAERPTFRMMSKVAVPSSRRMRQRSASAVGSGLVALARVAPVAVVVSLVGSACTRGEPPQWDAGAGVSLAVVPLTLDAATVAVPDAVVDGRVDAALPPAPGGDESGRLPQTHARPEPAGDAFDGRVRALFDGIARDDVARAMPFFFPLPAYAQVKAIANPAADWKARLVAHYARDIHALHLKLGPNAGRARFVAADVPMDRARWVEPGEEYNRIGYFRVYGTKLRGELDGAPIVIDVTSLISWRGEWFVVHLAGVK
jgi:hypothetical protein